MDCVLDLADDPLADGGAVPGRVVGRGGGLLGVGEGLREHDAAADGAADGAEGGGEVNQGAWRGGWCRGRLGVGGGGLPGLRGGLRLQEGLAVQEAGEVGADVDQAVQNLMVALRACGLGVRGLGTLGLVAGVVAFGLGCVSRHEQKKNIVGGAASRLGLVRGATVCGL